MYNSDNDSSNDSFWNSSLEFTPPRDNQWHASSWPGDGEDIVEQPRRLIGDVSGGVDGDEDGTMGFSLRRPADLRSDGTMGASLRPTGPVNRSNNCFSIGDVSVGVDGPPTDPVDISKLTNADATLATETRGNGNIVYHGGDDHGGMRWQKADGGEDDLVSLSNNLSGRGKEGGSVDDAQVVGGGNNSHSEDEAQVDGGRGKEGGRQKLIILTEQILGDCLSSDEEKADGGEDDLVSLNNNLSGRGEEGGCVNDAQVVGGGNNSHCEDEAQIDGGRGKVCKFFSRGDCKNGDKCSFRHDIDQGILKRGRGKGCTKRRNTERSNRQSNGGREGKRQRSWRK
jgi:hypothetical protein